MRRSVVAAGMVALVAGACGGQGSVEDDARLVPMGDGVEISDGDTWQPVSGTLDLSMGSQVRTAGGYARLDLPGGGSIELAPGSQLRLQEPGISELIQGSALASTPLALTLDLGEVRVEGSGVEGSEGTFRVDRAFQYRVRVYEGEARVPGSSWDGTVLPFQQVPVVNGRIDAVPRPVDVDPSDPWDQRIFGQALSTGASLDRLEKGLAAQRMPRDPADVSRALAPEGISALQLRSVFDAAPSTQWAQVVVASFLASQFALEGDPTSVLGDILTWLGDGASWTVVVARWALPESVVSVVAGAAASLVDLFRVRSTGGFGSGLFDFLQQLVDPRDPGDGRTPPGGTKTRGSRCDKNPNAPGCGSTPVCEAGPIDCLIEGVSPGTPDQPLDDGLGGSSPAAVDSSPGDSSKQASDSTSVVNVDDVTSLVP
ncbi:MAG TPA: hypothetical protein VGB51_00645 [Actinomycetota bacterium]